MALSVQDQTIVASAFDQASDAMMITDAAERIVRINRQFTRLTGYAAADLVGQTPAILRSGKNPPHFFDDFWASLNSKGSWQGEIWDRKKSGRLFIADLTVSSILNHHGKVQYYFGIYRDITATREAQAKREAQDSREPQTFLLTRSAFRQHLAEILGKMPAQYPLAALLQINFDRFSEINDLYGSAVGDQILYEAARRLRRSLRDGDIIGRLSGDEFAVILPDPTQPSDVDKVAGKIHERLQAPYDVQHAQKASPRCSIGLVPLAACAPDPDLALRLANQGLRAARAQGGGVIIGSATPQSPPEAATNDGFVRPTA